MSKKLYVGNLPFNSTEDDIRNLFAQHGEVLSVNIISDHYTGRSRGFCFVEMENADEAIAALNEKPFDGRNLKVNEARERQPRNEGGSRHDGGGRRGGKRSW